MLPSLSSLSRGACATCVSLPEAARNDFSKHGYNLDKWSNGGRSAIVDKDFVCDICLGHLSDRTDPKIGTIEDVQSRFDWPEKHGLPWKVVCSNGHCFHKQCIARLVPDDYNVVLCPLCKENIDDEVSAMRLQEPPMKAGYEIARIRDRKRARRSLVHQPARRIPQLSDFVDEEAMSVSSGSPQSHSPRSPSPSRVLRTPRSPPQVRRELREAAASYIFSILEFFQDSRSILYINDAATAREAARLVPPPQSHWTTDGFVDWYSTYFDTLSMGADTFVGGWPRDRIVRLLTALYVYQGGPPPFRQVLLGGRVDPREVADNWLQTVRTGRSGVVAALVRSAF